MKTKSVKIVWKWTEKDLRDFPHLSYNPVIEFSVIPASAETFEDLMWRIATEVYFRSQIVVPGEDSFRACIPGWDDFKATHSR